MSMFKVSFEKIGSVENHPNADRLDIVKVEGKDFDIITGRDSYQVGDYAVFFPVDSVMPFSLSEKLEITKNLKNGRIKTIKLRGMFSQGFVAKPEQLDLDVSVSRAEGTMDALIGIDISEALGVTKYEVPTDMTYGIKGNRNKTGIDIRRPGHLIQLPDGVVKYDLEGAQNYVKVVDEIMDLPVYISEKVEGSHWGCTIDSSGAIQVFQRNFSIVEAEETPHAWWETFRKMGFAEKLQQMMISWPDSNRITIRGEITGPGIQGNYYELDAATIFVFEIEINDKPVDAAKFANIADIFGLKCVPTLRYGQTLREYLGDKSVKEISDGVSAINGSKPREGIVIKPMKEMFSRELGGRLVLKQRGPEYLAGSGN